VLLSNDFVFFDTKHLDTESGLEASPSPLLPFMTRAISRHNFN